jgi:hypothetical protein
LNALHAERSLYWESLLQIEAQHSVEVRKIFFPSNSLSQVSKVAGVYCCQAWQASSSLPILQEAFMQAVHAQWLPWGMASYQAAYDEHALPRCFMLA